MFKTFHFWLQYRRQDFAKEEFGLGDRGRKESAEFDNKIGADSRD